MNPKTAKGSPQHDTGKFGPCACEFCVAVRALESENAKLQAAVKLVEKERDEAMRGLAKFEGWRSPEVVRSLQADLAAARERLQRCEKECEDCGAHGGPWKARAEAAEKLVQEHHNATLMAPWFGGTSAKVWGSACPVCSISISNGAEGGRETDGGSGGKSPGAESTEFNPATVPANPAPGPTPTPGGGTSPSGVSPSPPRGPVYGYPGPWSQQFAPEKRRKPPRRPSAETMECGT